MAIHTATEINCSHRPTVYVWAPCSKQRQLAQSQSASAASQPVLIERLRAVVLAPNYTPPRLPDEAVELLRLSRKLDVTFEEILTVLEHDVMLAGQVLRTAQSPIYGGSKTIRSLRQALVRLGMQTLNDIFFSAAMNQRVFRVPGYEKKMATLRRHSLVTAHIARIVSKYTSLFDESAFLCGLLHDVGIAALLLALSGTKHDRAIPFDDVWPTIVEMHAEASGVVCHAWGLSPEFVQAVRMHHSLTSNIQASDVHPLAAVVAVADDLARRLDAGAGESHARQSEGAMRILGLSDEAITHFEVESAALVFKVK